VFPSVEGLVNEQEHNGTSLGLVRPEQVIDIYVRRRAESDRKEWEEKQAQAVSQKELFVDSDTLHKDLAYMPIQYRIKFRCSDANCGTGHDMSVLDWGVYALSRKQYATRGAAMAERDVIRKIRMCLDSKHEAYFFLGNTKQYPQSFMIVGLYYPPKDQVAASSERKQNESLKLPGFQD